MKAPTVLLVSVLLAFSASAVKYKPHQRIYSNTLPPLQIIGVALSENMDVALESVEKRGKQQTGVQLQYPILVDEPAALVGGEGVTQSQMQEYIKDSWDMMSREPFSYTSTVATQYRLNRYGPVSLILLDRQRRIRALALTRSAVEAAHSNRFAEMVEYLLLNVGGVEAIPYDVSGMSDMELRQSLDISNPNGLYSWEHAAELQKREAQSGKTGSDLTPVYPLLGHSAPDFELPLLNGTGMTTLSQLAKDKVTLLVLFWAGGEKSNFTAVSQTTAAMEQLKAIDRIHVDWTLKLAEAGMQEYANAQPMAGTSTHLAQASTRGEYKSSGAAHAAAPVDTTPVAASDFGKEAHEAEEGKRFGVSIGLGLRHFTSPTGEFGDQELSQWSGAFGVKFVGRIYRFLAAEAAILPSIYGRSWKEENQKVTQEILVPLSVSAMIRPALGDGFFTPGISLGAGVSLASFQKRVPNENANPNFLTRNEPATFEYYFPDGLGFHVNAGASGEFRINQKIFIGLDLRYIFLDFAKPTLEDALEVQDESDEYASKALVQKEMDYRNTTILVYVGMKL